MAYMSDLRKNALKILVQKTCREISCYKCPAIGHNRPGSTQCDGLATGPGAPAGGDTLNEAGVAFFTKWLEEHPEPNADAQQLSRQQISNREFAERCIKADDSVVGYCKSDAILRLKIAEDLASFPESAFDDRLADRIFNF